MRSALRLGGTVVFALSAAAAPRVRFVASDAVGAAHWIRHAGLPVAGCLGGDGGFQGRPPTPVEHEVMAARGTPVDPPCGAEYRKQLWRPAKMRLVRQAGRLGAIAERAALPATLDAAARFAGAAWPDRGPLPVALVPLFGKPETTRAHTADWLVVLEMTEREDDLPDRYGVAVHELFHLAWAARGAERKQEIAGWFAGAPYVLDVLDEAVATVVGNVIAAERAGGRPRDDARWYDDQVVDGFARAIEPMVREYLAAGRALDDAFAREAVRRFGDRFPGGARRVDVALRRAVAVVDRVLWLLPEDLDRLAKATRNHFLPREFLDSPLDAYRSTAPLPALIVSRAEDLRWLARMDDLRAACPRIVEAARRAPAVVVVGGASGRLHLVVLARAKDEVLALLDGIAAAKVLPEEGELGQ